MGILIHQSTYI
jgi:hypothetical protein